MTGYSGLCEGVADPRETRERNVQNIIERIAKAAGSVVDVATATPAEIDTAIAELYGIRLQLGDHRVVVMGDLRRALGQRGRRMTGGWTSWEVSAPDTVAQARQVAAGEVEEPTFQARRAVGPLLVTLDGVDDALVRVVEARVPLDARYEAGPWTRYFWVQGNGGHGHRSEDCSTCNKGRNETRFGWHPELSGKTDADAIAVFKDRLCSVCFPDAPVAHKDALKPGQCKGSRQAPVDGTMRRFGPSRTGYGRCPVCPDGTDLRVLTAGGVLKAHAAPKSK